AVKFIETRREVQAAAFEAITRYLSQYEVETKGAYIQDVVFPIELVKVLTQREIANQEKATFEEQQRAETSRIEMEKAKGTANMQSQLASAQVGVQIKSSEAQAREAEAKGEAAYVQLTGEAEAARRQAIGLAEAKATEALGLARATGFEAPQTPRIRRVNPAAHSGWRNRTSIPVRPRSRVSAAPVSVIPGREGAHMYSWPSNHTSVIHAGADGDQPRRPLR